MAVPKDKVDATPQEVEKITRAMRDPQFRDLFSSYVDEISDPKNRAELDQYLCELEKKGEVPKGCVLIRPQAGCCVRTSVRFANGVQQKMFINVVQAKEFDDLELIPHQGGGVMCNLPFSLGNPKPDRDSAGVNCLTVDIAVGKGTLARAMVQPPVLKLIIDTVADNLNKHYMRGGERIQKDFKLMQNLKCKGGTPSLMSVREESLKGAKGKKAVSENAVSENAVSGDGPVDVVTPKELGRMVKCAKEKQETDNKQGGEGEEEEEETKKADSDEESPETAGVRRPKFKVVHQGVVEFADFVGNESLPTAMRSVPKNLRVEVKLPGVKSASEINVDLTEKGFVLEVKGRYYLDIPLPFAVLCNDGRAKFDKSRSVIEVTAPVDSSKLTKVDFEKKEEDEELTPSDDGEEDETETEIKETVIAETANKETADGEGVAEAAVAAETTDSKSETAVAETAAETAVEKSGDQETHVSPSDASMAVSRIDFIPSSTFTGSKRGYFFTRGEHGMGYYRDTAQQDLADDKFGGTLNITNGQETAEKKIESETAISETGDGNEPLLQAVKETRLVKKSRESSAEKSSDLKTSKEEPMVQELASTETAEPPRTDSSNASATSIEKSKIETAKETETGITETTIDIDWESSNAARRDALALLGQSVPLKNRLFHQIF